MARKKRVSVEPKKNPTAFLFTSLMLILLTFFIILSSMGTYDEKKHKLALNSLLGSFGILPGGRSPHQDLGGKDLMPQTAPFQDTLLDIRKIRASLIENGVLNGLGVSEGKLGVTITIRSNILFDDATDVLSPESTRVLDVLTGILSQIRNDVIITGHTDSIPVETPPYDSNWGLSAARSLAVLQQFSSRGIAHQRLAAYGMGAQRPITTNSTEAGRRLNSRVEITLVGDLPSQIDMKALEETQAPPLWNFQYRGYNFELKEQ
ncbi:MAG TPA: hypothetical protein ENN34_10425 [Deltaproteobacteria bacterium]|nr:hypothetical protein [Deltaproteobacteria bacterium]